MGQTGKLQRGGWMLEEMKMQSKDFWRVFMEMKICSESDTGWSDLQELSVAGK